jgi:hypothetical protein
VSIFFCAFVAFAAEPQTVDEVIAKHIEARGGAEKIAAMKTVRQTGKLDMGDGKTPTLISEQKRPNLMRMDLVLTGRTAIRAFDGKNGWYFMPQMGHTQPQPADAETMKELTEESDFGGPLIDAKQKGHKLELAGREAVDGKDCYKIKVTRAGTGDVRDYYLDVDTFLESRITGDSPAGSFSQTLSDYKKVDGVMFPFTSVVEITSPTAPPQKYTYKVETIEVNVDLPDTHFAMPTTAPSK